MKKYLLLIIILIMSHSSFAEERISNLIAPVSYFVNHVKQLKSVDNNLKKYRQASIVGISGMGKTQLARTYAYENKDNYNIIYFFDCNQDIKSEFVKLAKQLNEVKKANISEEAGSAQKEVLEYLTSRDKWLLVFDNLKIGENNKVQDLVAWEHNGNVIFCSQEGTQVPNVTEMTIFDQTNAVTLATNLLDNKDQQSIEFLAQSFDGYPMLIVQGTQLLNQVKGLDKDEYKQKIYQSADKIKSNITLATNQLTPSASQLLHKIALINNQAFSKQILSIITDSKDTIDDDIYQLSKFVLISNIDSDENNPVFEMHDIVAQKIRESNEDTKNKLYLEDIVVKITKSLPTTMHTGHIFRRGKTVNENLKVITSHQQKYNVSIYKLLPLNASMFTDYINKLQFYEAEKLFSWFHELEQREQFKLFLMNDEIKYSYSRMLSNVGGYYKHRFSNWHKALEYYLRANYVLKNMKGYSAYRCWQCDVFYNLANCYISLGYVNAAQDKINAMQEMFNTGAVDIKEIGMLHLVKAKFYYNTGYYIQALEQSDKDLIETSKTGIKLDDLFFTPTYILRAEILNSLSRYHEAYAQAEQLYKMHKPVQKEEQVIFGRIYTQMARAELGIGNIETALKYARKAKTIFINDQARNNKEGELDNSKDTDLATALIAEGDVLSALGKSEEAMSNYKLAKNIYWNIYGIQNLGNMDNVSYLFAQAAKTACNLPDKINAQIEHDYFYILLIKFFGIEHHRSIGVKNYVVRG